MASSSTIHLGIVCDSCDVNICGMRFKCLLCPDYYLCSLCEGKGSHLEHDMTEIYIPYVEPAQWKDVHHPCVKCDGCGDFPIRGTRYKCRICPDYNLCSDCKNMRFHRVHSMMRIRKPRVLKESMSSEAEPCTSVHVLACDVIKDEQTFVKNVIREKRIEIINHLNPETVLDMFMKKNVFGDFTVSKVRDIREKGTTSEKNRCICDAIEQDHQRYTFFKTGLAGQDHLVGVIESYERLLHKDQQEHVCDHECTEENKCPLLAKFKCPEIPMLTKEVLEIRDYLISLYNKNCQTMPIYPLKPEWRKHVQGLYVTPTMVEINPRGVDLEHTKDRAGLFSSDNRETKVDDIRSIFYKGDTLCTDICLVGESGSGKSVLCEYLVHLWVKCHSSSSQPDDNFMKNFNFLFYISLRYAESCDVESIIRDQLKIPHAEEISKFLSENTWLLILDGLDEFSQTSKPSRFQSQNIPTRHHSPKSTYLTTSRPWKIELLRKELENKMDRHIAILGMEGKEQKQLATNVLDLLNHDKGRNKTVEDFFKDVTDQKLSKQLESPVLLMQMLGIWFSGKLFGRYQCDIYSNTVEMQLQFTEEIKCISVDQTHLTTETETQVQLPACFKDFVFCQKYKSLLLKLSKLANQQLFSKNREATLVFDHGQMEISGMSETEITLCLKLGLLTQFKVIGEITQRRKSVSFVHKSYQEFFAAIYLSQTSIDSDLKQLFEGFSDLARALEIEKVFTFVSGMNPSVSCEIAKAIMQHVNVDPRVQQYRASCANQHAPNEDLVKRIQGVILAGIEEGKYNDVNTPPLQLQDIWMKNDDRDFPPSRIFACKTALDLSHVKSVYIREPGDISRDEIWRLFKASLPNLQKLVLRDCGISVERVKKVVRRNGGDLQALGLYYYGSDIVDFSRLWQINLRQILAAPNKSLGLAGVRLTHAQMGFLSQHLSTRSFTELSLCRLYCTEHGYSGECLSLDLTASRDINRLTLDRLPLQNVAFHPERLVTCYIWDLPETVTADATRRLYGAEQLEVLMCWGYAASALVELGRTLPSLTNLWYIALCDVDLRGHEQLLVSDQKKLERIILHRVTLTADHLRRLLASLPPHRVEVKLGKFGLTVTITGDTTDLIKEISDSPDIDVTKKGDVKREGDKCTVQDFVFYTKK